MDTFDIWKRTLAAQNDEFEPQRTILRQAFLDFRSNIEHLVGEISGLLPDLTVHNISHLDALWRVADQIAGPDYPLNPAEAFVLGGAILLHDSAHVLAAYEDRLNGIRATAEWKDLVAQQFHGNAPEAGSSNERYALFQVLRMLHARQARQLPSMEWRIPGTPGAGLRLLPHPTLLDYYGSLIGEIAESHHWSPRRVGEEFDTRHVNAPAILAPATWQVDALKVAFLLRTADAAHVDAMRAPWFLFALRQPSGVSADHWRFQAKMGQPTRADNGELRLTSGSPFGVSERRAWWLAYDTACMIDRELRDAQLIMRDLGRRTFAVGSVARVSTPASFARDVLVRGWEPINVAPQIRDIPKVIANLGGARLYGDDPAHALRELIQNAADAVRAMRAIGQLGIDEGEIEVWLERRADENWLHVTDSGVGMSRYVLTEVLLDFGTSFWSSESSRTELPGLASSGFKPIGKFGIGFFATFMLSSRIIVNTRRFRKSSSDSSDQWILEFGNSLDSRPMLRQPSNDEELRRPGTKVSALLSDVVLKKLVGAYGSSWKVEGIPHEYDPDENLSVFKESPKRFGPKVASLCPTLDIALKVRLGNGQPVPFVRPNDWLSVDDGVLLQRLYPTRDEKHLGGGLLDLKEPNGLVVGRIRHRHGRSQAVATYGGIKIGTAPQLEGVLLANNNSDLARQEARPIATLAAWRAWGRKMVDVLGDRDADALADLHPLCPERDLPVYLVNDSRLTSIQLSEWLQGRSEVIVHDEELDHSEYDEISRDTFRSFIKRDADVVFLPQTSGMLARDLRVELIDYAELFERILDRAWGEYERDLSDQVVAHVSGFEVERAAIRYSR